MVNRRIARGSRSKQKKKSKVSKKAHISENLSRHSGKSDGLNDLHHTTDNGSIPRIRLLSGRKTRKLKSSRAAVSAGILSKLKKKKSLMLKKQAVERMVLKEHIRGLEARRATTRRGENAKAERRELGKYIRQLKEEQRVKHTSELQNVEAELVHLFEVKKQKAKNLLDEETPNAAASEMQDWEDFDDESEKLDSVDEKELQEMFSHLTA